ncbi:hypothetical protein ACWEHL_08210, partial [Streptomyces sp. NPDC004726]
PDVGLYDPRVGQTPARKAAQAARGQRPKERSGKAQREAPLRVQAAKKKAGGGKAAKKAAAKKAVPLPGRVGAGRVPGHLHGLLQGLRQGRGHHEGDGRLGTPWLRAPADVGSRAGVRPEQVPDRERRDVPRPEALGLAARSLAVQHPPAR